MRAWRLASILALAGLVLAAGCIGTETSEDAAQAEAGGANVEAGESEAQPRAVVASIDRGWNPYHELFRRPAWDHHPSEAVPGLPEDMPWLNLTFDGSYEENLEADEDVWANVSHDEIYWVEGTNLLFWDRSDRPGRGLEDRLADNGLSNREAQRQHGVETSSAVTLACEECYVLAVVDGTSGDGQTIEDIADRHPWVDFISMTWIDRDYTQTDRVLLPGASDLAEASRAFHEEGGLFFGLSGNEGVSVTPEVQAAGYSWPPWVVMVGGAYEDCQGTSTIAGVPTEFVAPPAFEVAEHGTTNGTTTGGHTSIATPYVAGSFASTLIDVRRNLGTQTGATEALWSGPSQGPGVLEDGSLTNEELRHVFSRTASYFDTGAWSCGDAFRPPATPTPWIDMGWGFVGPDQAENASKVIRGEQPLPDKPEGAKAWMSAYTQARQALYPWDSPVGDEARLAESCPQMPARIEPYADICQRDPGDAFPRAQP